MKKLMGVGVCAWRGEGKGKAKARACFQGEEHWELFLRTETVFEYFLTPNSWIVKSFGWMAPSL